MQRVLDFWVLQGRWWHAEVRRIYFRVVVSGRDAGRAVWVIYRSEEEWVLWEVFD